MCTDCSTHRGGSNSTSLQAESSIALFSVVVCVDWGLADRNLLRITSESANNLQTHRIDVWCKHIEDEGRTTNITRLHRYILTNSADEYTAMLAYKSTSYPQRNFLWNDAAYLIKPLAYHFFWCTVPINDILLIRIVTFKANNYKLSTLHEKGITFISFILCFECKFACMIDTKNWKTPKLRLITMTIAAKSSLPHKDLDPWFTIQYIHWRFIAWRIIVEKTISVFFSFNEDYI